MQNNRSLPRKQYLRAQKQSRQPPPEDIDDDGDDGEGEYCLPCDIDFPRAKSTDLPADIVLARLKTLRLRITGSGPSWKAICPAHNDTDPSLSITETAEGILLLHCFGQQCRSDAILAKLGLKERALYPSRYALQFGRKPQSTIHFGGSEVEGKVAEPTDKECRAWAKLLKQWPMQRYTLNQLAVHLDLPRDALSLLHVGYDEDENCWIFPERDDKGRIVGLAPNDFWGCNA